MYFTQRLRKHAPVQIATFPSFMLWICTGLLLCRRHHMLCSAESEQATLSYSKCDCPTFPEKNPWTLNELHHTAIMCVWHPGTHLPDRQGSPNVLIHCACFCSPCPASAPASHRPNSWKRSKRIWPWRQQIPKVKTSESRLSGQVFQRAVLAAACLACAGAGQTSERGHGPWQS